MTIPLDNYSILHSHDLDEVREKVSNSYCSHSLYMKSPRDHLNARHHRVSFGDISFNYLSYGADVTVVPGEFERFYMIEIPLSGSAHIHYGKNVVHSEGNMGAIVSSTEPVKSEWSGDAQRLMVQIDRNVMERFACEHLGHALKKPIDFELEFDLSNGMNAGLRSYIEYVIQQVGTNNYFEKFPLVRKQVVRTILTMLLHAQQNNYSEQLHAVESPGAPRSIEKAYEYIMAYFAEDISIEDLVKVSGISSRALFSGFKRYKGITPMMALKTRRLQAVREDLMMAREDETVTRIAHKWGFTHMGNFARDYQLMFGEKPSRTFQKFH